MDHETQRQIGDLQEACARLSAENAEMRSLLIAILESVRVLRVRSGESAAEVDTALAAAQDRSRRATFAENLRRLQEMHGRAAE